MNYPKPTTKTVIFNMKRFFGIFKKTIVLRIPQATLSDLSEFNALSDMDKIAYIVSKLSIWGAGKHAYDIYRVFPQVVEEVLRNSFFYKREVEKLPESVKKLRDIESVYDYDSPESTLFATVSTEYGIPPKELLGYTMDELVYLMNALEWKYLNEKQKKELQRLKRVEEMKSQKDKIDNDVEFLTSYFENTYGR